MCGKNICYENKHTYINNKHGDHPVPFSHITINILPTVNCKLGKTEMTKTTVVFKLSFISSGSRKCSWGL